MVIVFANRTKNILTIVSKEICFNILPTRKFVTQNPFEVYNYDTGQKVGVFKENVFDLLTPQFQSCVRGVHVTLSPKPEDEVFTFRKKSDMDGPTLYKKYKTNLYFPGL